MEKEPIKCPNCGATLIPSKTENHLVCPYCDSIFHFDKQPVFSISSLYEKIVKLVSNSDCGINGEVYIGSSLKNSDLFQTAKKYFQIPDEEDCCMLYNCSLLRSFTSGFALCSTGLYYRVGRKKTGKLSYAQLKYSNFSAMNGDFYIDDLCFISFSDLGSIYCMLFKKIQKLIPEDII